MLITLEKFVFVGNVALIVFCRDVMIWNVNLLGTNDKPIINHKYDVCFLVLTLYSDIFPNTWIFVSVASIIW